MQVSSISLERDKGVSISSYSIAKNFFISYIFKYKSKLWIASVLMVIFAMCNSMQIWLIKPALDKIFISKDSKFLMLVPLALVIISLIKLCTDYFQSYLIKSVGQKVVTDLQLNLYKHLISSKISTLYKHSSGNIVSRFMSDINNIRTTVSLVVVNLAKEVFLIIGSVIIMIYNDPYLAAIAILVFPLIILPISKLGRKMRKITHATQEELSKYATRLDENFKNIKIIKSFCAEDEEIANTKEHLTKLLKNYLRSTKVDSLSSPLIEVFGVIALAFIILYGGSHVLSGNTTAGGFLAFIVAMISAYQPLKSLSNMNIVLQTGVASAARINDILESNSDIEETEKLSTLKVKFPSIEFKNVSFNYAGKKNTIKNVSFEIKPNQLVAFVGASGSGKSTIIDLLLKFYKPDSGEILIDDEDIARVSNKSVRQNISLVNQDVMLFDRSIGDNIKYNTPNATNADLTRVGDMAGISEFISTLDNDYDSEVGQFGSQLSGGQKQKIAIARSLLKDSSIIVFDEATSALDQVSEQLIKNTLVLLKHNKTIIMVTHRLATIQDFDMIYVLKNGELVESGKHQELIDSKGEYYRLYMKKH